MKTKFIKNYITGERVNETFLLTQKMLCVSKKGDNYLSLKLSDKSGDIDGKKWDTTENEYNSLNEGGYYTIKGVITDFQGIMQMRIDSIVKPSESFNAEDFMKCSPRDITEMKAELKEFISSVKDENCKKLLDYFFKDKSFSKKFAEAPAAKVLHHGYVAGLIEHTLEVCKIADNIAKVYPFVKRDILITGSILHDIGKVKEYEIKGAIDFTAEGYLLGHLVMGAMMVHEACKELELDDIFAYHTEHMILSHHGKYEWGSPKRPKSLESILLHFADDISFNVTLFTELTKEESDDLFTKNSKNPFERRLFKGYINEYNKSLEEKENKPEIYDDFLSFFESYNKN